MPAFASVLWTTWLITTDGWSPPLTSSFQLLISAADRPEAASSAFALSMFEGVSLVIGLVEGRARRRPGQRDDFAKPGIADAQDAGAIHQIVEGLTELRVPEWPARRVDAEHLHERTRALNELDSRHSSDAPRCATRRRR